MSEKIRKKRNQLLQKMEENEDERHWLRKQQEQWEVLQLEESHQNERLTDLFSTGELAHFFQDLRQQHQRVHYQMNEEAESFQQALKKTYRQLEEDELSLHLEERRQEEQANG